MSCLDRRTAEPTFINHWMFSSCSLDCYVPYDVETGDFHGLLSVRAPRCIFPSNYTGSVRQAELAMSSKERALKPGEGVVPKQSSHVRRVPRDAYAQPHLCHRWGE